MCETDRLVFETAYSLHYESLVRRLTARTRNEAVAEDLAQEAFLRLLGEINAGRTPDDIPAWLQRVAMNLVASRGRHLMVVNRRDGQVPIPAGSPNPEHEALDREVGDALRTALADLPTDDRRAMLLAAHGYRGQEIAAMVARTPGATRTLLFRARARVREQLLVAGFGPA